MKVNAMYTTVENKRNLFANPNIRLGSRSQTKKDNEVKNQQTKDDNSSVVKVQKSTTADIIEGLKKQIQEIKKNDRLNEDTKKAKVEVIMEQIQKLEEAEKKKQLEELTKAIKSDDRSEKEKELEAKAKARKEELGNRNKKLDGVDITISKEGFKSLIKAEMQIDRAEDARILKSKKELEAHTAKAEYKNDVERGQAMADEIKKEEIGRIADKINKEVSHEFNEKYGSLQKQIVEYKKNNPGDPVPIEAMIEQNSRAMRDEITKRLDEIINNPQFNAKYQFSNEEKEALISDLESVVNKIEKQAIKSLKSANEEAKNINKGVKRNKSNEKQETEDTTVQQINNPNAVAIELEETAATDEDIQTAATPQ